MPDSGSVYFWGRSLAGEMGLPGYLKFPVPTYCDLLEGRRIARVLVHKNASVCFEGTRDSPETGNLIVMGKFENHRHASLQADGDVYEVRCAENIAVAVLMDAGLVFASGNLPSPDSGQLFVLRQRQLHKVPLGEPVKFLAGVRDELLVFFAAKLLRCKFDPESFEQELASAQVCSIDFEVVFQKPKLTSAATGSFSAAIEVRRRELASPASSVVLQEAGLSIGNQIISLFVETLRKSPAAGSILASQTHDSITSHSHQDFNSLNTVRNAASLSHSRPQLLQLDSLFTHKQSQSHKLAPAETKRRLLDLSQHTPDRSRLEDTLGLRREPSLKGLSLLNLSRREASSSNSLARAEEFESRLKEELKRIEQKHKHQVHTHQLAVSFAGSNDSHEQPSLLTAGNQRARKQRDHILESWPEDRAEEDHETIRTKKMNLIRSLIHDQRPIPGTEQASADLLPKAPTSCKLDKKLKFAQIKENLSRIEVIPSELVSHKDTIDYELSDNDPSDADHQEFQATINFNLPTVILQENKAYRQPENFARENLQVFYPKAAVPQNQKPISQAAPAHAKPIEHTNTPETPFLSVEAREQTSNQRATSQEIHKISQQQVCDFIILLDKKVSLISRVKRRVHLKHFFSMVKLVYTTAIEKEKTEQSHEILKLLGHQYYVQCMEEFRETVLQIRFLVNSAAENIEVDQYAEEEQKQDQPGQAEDSPKPHSVSGSNPEQQSQDQPNSDQEAETPTPNPKPQTPDPLEPQRDTFGTSVESRDNCDLEFEINQQSPEKPPELQQTRLDEFRVRRLLIITKTLLFQKLYILNHEFFSALRTQSEQKKKRTKTFMAKVEQAKKNIDLKHLKYCMHKVFAFAKIRALLSAFTKQCKHEYFAALRQFNHDRSLLACTASEISMVKDESLDIPHRKTDSKYHLARYINSHFIQSDQPQGDQARQRGRKPNPQNTLEEIRHELSELNSKKLEEISGISRMSDGSRQPDTRTAAKPSSDREVPGGRIFSNEKLKGLTNPWHAAPDLPRLPPTRSKSESFQPVNLSPSDNLIDIQFAPPSPEPAELSVKPKKHDYLEPQSGAIMFETFKKTSGTELDLRKSARFGENSVAEHLQWEQSKPQLAAFDQIEEEELNESVRQLEKLSELFKKKTPGQEAKKQETRFFPQTQPAVNSSPAKPEPTSQLANIEKNLGQVEQFIKHSEQPAANDNQEASWPKEPSDDVAWAKSHFNQGLNFLDKPPAPKQPEANPLKKEPAPKLPPQKEAKSRPASKERLPDTPKHESVERKLEASKETPSQKKQALLGREGKPPLAYSKTQESFRNFFKKLDSDKKDREKGDGSARAPVDVPDVSQLDLTGQEARQNSEAPMPQSRERTPRVSKSKPQSLTPSNKLKSAKNHAGPVVQSFKELPIRPPSGSLADRLERIIHDKQAPQTTKNPIRAELSQHSSMLSPDVTGVFRNTMSSDKIKTSNQKKKPTDSLADRISAGSNSKKPAIKIRAELSNNRSNRGSISPNKPQPGIRASQKSHPHLPIRPEKPQKTPDLNRLQSKGSKETSKEKLLQSAKSIRTVSGRSEVSKKLDTSNEGFRERYAAVRGELKKSSYIKIADSRKAYQGSK